MKLREWLAAEAVARDHAEWAELNRYVDFRRVDAKRGDLTARLNLYGRAIAQGAVWKSPRRLFWDISGRCEGNVIIDIDSRWVEDDKAMPFVPEGDRAVREVAYFMDLKVPCRRCSACLRARAREWRIRGATEIRRSARTWFGTFTLRPEAHYHMLARARLPKDVHPEDEFIARHREISKEFTKYWKRVRKYSGASIRYLLVAERHKSGLPHYHALIHEVTEVDRVTHALLTAQWPFGFTRFKLVDTAQHASYVAKYLSKDAVARVRASQRYGKDDLSS